jgi:hypothetical protein
MIFMLLRALVVLLFAMCLTTHTVGDQPKKPAANDGLPKGLMPTPGIVRLPGGASYQIYLDIKERKGKTFTGTLTYDLGLRETVFEVEGTIDEKGISFQETRVVGMGHPHCPSLGGGKYEKKRNEKVGVAYLRLRTETPYEFAQIAYGMRAGTKCEFVLGAFLGPDGMPSR